MMEIKGFITNLGKYNEGQLVGEWVTFPVDEDDMAEVLNRIGINDEYEEYFFTDWEQPEGLDLGEYESIEKVNEIAERIENFDDEQQMVLQACMEEFNSFDEAADTVESGDYVVYYGYNSMEEVAQTWIDETGMLANVPDTLRRYFDYEAFGRDLEIEGTFVEYEDGYIEIIC